MLLVLGVLFAGLSFLASGLLAPRKRPTAAKLAPYECGIVPDREPPQRFPVRFYLVAMIFIIFDIEIVFLYPWAVVFRAARTPSGSSRSLVFAVVVFVSFLYLVSQRRARLGPGQAPAARPCPSGPPSRRSPVSGPVRGRAPDRLRKRARASWGSRTSSTTS